MNACPPFHETRNSMGGMLERMVADRFGSRCRITAWHRRKSAYSSSCQITNLQVTLDGNDSHSFVLKNLEPASWLPTAREVRPAFLYDSEREIHVYQKILSQIDCGTPRFVGSHVDRDSHQYWLLLERARGPLLWQVGQDRHWKASARWLAKFHHLARPLSLGIECDDHANLIRYNEPCFLNWANRAEGFLSNHFDTGDTAMTRRFRVMFNRYDRVARFLSRLPQTLIHGEFYPSNVIMRRECRSHHVCPIDWELAGTGSGVLDLAALSFGDWSPEKKRELIRAYHQALPSASELQMTLGELHEAVDFGHLHCCIRQLGWASNWRAPDLHSRNWAQDALLLAEKLGLLS